MNKRNLKLYFMLSDRPSFRLHGNNLLSMSAIGRHRYTTLISLGFQSHSHTFLYYQVKTIKRSKQTYYRNKASTAKSSANRF